MSGLAGHVVPVVVRPLVDDKQVLTRATAEGRVRKVQRTGGTDTRRKSSAPSVTSAPRPPPQDGGAKTSANFRGRRQSVRDHKVPQGPRPYEKQR